MFRKFGQQVLATIAERDATISRDRQKAPVREDELKAAIRAYSENADCMQQGETSRLAREVISLHAPGLAIFIHSIGYVMRPGREWLAKELLRVESSGVGVTPWEKLSDQYRELLLRKADALLSAMDGEKGA